MLGALHLFLLWSLVSLTVWLLSWVEKGKRVVENVKLHPDREAVMSNVTLVTGHICAAGYAKDI